MLQTIYLDLINLYIFIKIARIVYEILHYPRNLKVKEYASHARLRDMKNKPPQT